MDPKYVAWIAQHYPTFESAYGQCARATQSMVVVFPELRRVCGHFYDLRIGEREHWWCVAPDGTIVDPTLIQFPSGRLGAYVELDPNEPRPTGKCPNCGEYIYDGRYVHERCEAEYVAYCNNPY